MIEVAMGEQLKCNVDGGDDVHDGDGADDDEDDNGNVCNDYNSDDYYTGFDDNEDDDSDKGIPIGFNYVFIVIMIIQML